MKKFKYYGREVEVPDYAQYVAVDADGEAWWYTEKPRINFYTWSGNGSDCGRVGHFDNVKNWKGSIRSC